MFSSVLVSCPGTEAAKHDDDDDYVFVEFRAWLTTNVSGPLSSKEFTEHSPKRCESARSVMAKVKKALRFLWVVHLEADWTAEL